MKRNVFNWILRALTAGLLAFTMLCAFCFFYYNVPVHYTNESGATEYKWEANCFYSKGTEGFALGRTNNDGFNNLCAWEPGAPVDILLMGSSHMEGFNVAQDENAAAVLAGLFSGRKSVYSIGTAGHTLLYCVKHLDRALAVYKPAQYVLIETSKLDFSPADMDAAVDGTLADIPSHTGGLIRLLQELPYLRLLYTKYIRNGGEGFGDTDTASAPAADPVEKVRALNALLAKISRVSAERGVTPVVVYDPALHVGEDGQARVDTDPEALVLFAALCENNGVLFLDLGPRFLAEYRENAALPFGFSNTAPGEGHINRVGHRLFAEAVYALITGKEG